MWEVLVKYLYQYCKNEQNDHLHKDNIYKTTEVNGVRESTFLLYFLLLGAFIISDSDIQKLGFNNAIEQTGIMGLWILAVRFWEWVMPILNTCEANDSIICFDPCYVAENCEELRIAETKSFDVVDYENELKKLEYHEDVFLFDLGNERTDKEKGEILSTIISICLNYRKETMNDRHRYVLILYGFGYEIL